MGSMMRPCMCKAPQVVMIDAAGTLQWQRVDSYRSPGSTLPLGQEGNFERTSISE